MNKQGWLKQQLDDVEEEVKDWPKWMLDVNGEQEQNQKNDDSGVDVEKQVFVE